MERLYPITEEVRFQNILEHGISPVNQTQETSWIELLGIFFTIVVAGGITYYFVEHRRTNERKNQLIQTS